MKYLLILIFLPLMAIGQTEIKTGVTIWQTDYDTALSEAKGSDKNLLVYFTGSDWCAPCKMLKKDLFVKEEFEKASKSYALLYIDIPRDKELLSEAQLAHNKEVLSKFNKKGLFPFFKVLNSEEKELDEYSGYNMNGEIGYHLEFLRKNK